MSSLTAEHVTHPLDRQGFQRLMAKIGGSMNRLLAGEKDFFLFNLADNTRLGPRQGASVVERVRALCGKLGLELPYIFLENDPKPRSYSLCGDEPSLVLTSGLLDRLDGEVLDTAIAHELGHILCGHSFYRLIAEQFDQLASFADSILPLVGKLVSGGYRLSLFDWYRKSELSADRAAMLAVGNPQAVKQYLMVLAGGSGRLADELDPNAFTDQARELMERLKKRQSGLTGRLSFFVTGLAALHKLSTHPWPAVRLLELERWLESEHYRLLQAGELEKALELPDDVPNANEDPTVVAGQDVVGFFKGMGRSATSAVSGVGRSATSTMKGLFGLGGDVDEAPPDTSETNEAPPEEESI